MKNYTAAIAFLLIVLLMSLIMTAFFGFSLKALAAGYLFSLIVDRLDDIKKLLIKIELWKRFKS